MRGLLLCPASQRLRSLPVPGTSALARRSGEPRPEIVSPTSILAGYTSTHPVPTRASLEDVRGRPTWTGMHPESCAAVCPRPQAPLDTWARECLDLPAPEGGHRSSPHPRPFISGKKGVSPLARASESYCSG